MTTAEELYEKYKDTISEVIVGIKTQKEAAIPRIVVVITTDIVPKMMKDVGRLKTLYGSEKRQLIIDSIELAIEKTFFELNKIPELKAASWDETLRDYLLVLIPPTIKLLVDVEQKNITFNRKISGCFTCCTGH
jgi:hypothetical protein